MPRFRIMTDDGPLAVITASDEEAALVAFNNCYIVEPEDEWSGWEPEGADATPVLILNEED
jgi:hypothetical protein